MSPSCKARTGVRRARGDVARVVTTTCDQPVPVVLTRAVALSDVELLQDSARGDQASFEELYRRHVGACRRRARYVLAADDWVPDVVQAVFLDLWTQAGRFDGKRGSVRAWVLVLTHHKAVDLVRVQSRHASRRAQEELLAAHVDQAPTPEQRVSLSDLTVRLRTAVAQVGPVEREVLELCFLQGRTQREAADLLGIPLGTVKTRSRRAVQELGRALDRSVWL